MRMSMHDDKTRLMSLRPSKIGLEDIMISTGEANLFRDNNYDLLHQPDNLFFDPWTKTLYNVEYKCSGNKKKALKQLTECAEKLAFCFPDYKIQNLYVSKNYQITKV